MFGIMGHPVLARIAKHVLLFNAESTIVDRIVFLARNVTVSTCPRRPAAWHFYNLAYKN